MLAHRRDVEHVGGIGGETGLPLVGDDDGDRLVGLEDGRVLDDVAQDRFPGAGRADDDQGLRGKVDVLFVLHVVGGDGLVAELAQLDADFVGGRLVGTAAHHGPVGPRHGVASGRDLDPVACIARTFRMWPGRARSCSISRVTKSSPRRPFRSGKVEVEQGARDDLGVERLGGGHGHFNVPAAAGVHHAVDLEGEVRIPAVDDGQGVGAPLPHHVHGPVGVGGGAGLADGHHQGVLHAAARPSLILKPLSLRGLQGRDLQVRDRPCNRPGCRRRPGPRRRRFPGRRKRFSEWSFPARAFRMDCGMTFSSRTIS